MHYSHFVGILLFRTQFISLFFFYYSRNDIPLLHSPFASDSDSSSTSIVNENASTIDISFAHTRHEPHSGARIFDNLSFNKSVEMKYVYYVCAVHGLKPQWANSTIEIYRVISGAIVKCNVPKKWPAEKWRGWKLHYTSAYKAAPIHKTPLKRRERVVVVCHSLRMFINHC